MHAGLREGLCFDHAPWAMSESFPPLHTEDLQQVKRLLKGDEQAFRRFFDEVFPRLHRFVLRHCGEPAVADEISQSAMVTAMEGLHRYRGEASLLAWCFGIARLQLQRHRQLASRRLPLEDESHLEAMIDALRLNAAQEPDSEAEAAQLRDRVHAILDRLPGVYAEVLEGRYVLGLSVRELAEQLGRTEKATESALSRARDAFRHAFGALQSHEVS